MEPVSDVEEVGVDEAHGFGDVGLESGAGVEHELNPSLGSLMSNVVLQCSSNLALASKGTVDPFVEGEGFKSRHYSSAKFIITNHLH